MPSKYTTASFIEKANKIHNNKYDYSNVTYTKSTNKIRIICKTHGEFEQMPANHLQGQGCPECGGTKRLNTKKFIEKSKLLYGNTYNYNKVVYKNYKQKVKIICPIHGVWEVTPSDHLTKNSKCPECASNHLSNTEDWVNKARKIHENKYNYENTNYIKATEKVQIECKIHGVFHQAPYHHLEGSGCPACAEYGFSPNKPAILYYLKITTEDNQTLYKIGITNRTVNERFSLTDLSKIEIIKQKLYENGQDALNWENKLKRKYKEFQYKGPDVLENGNTELFTEDIIAMWYND